MKLRLGFSPCPNDTFIFDALIHHKIDTEGLEFEVSYQDVETLNQGAFRGDLDITKLSYHAFAFVTNQYQLLDAGSALGHGVGPLLICKDASHIQPLQEEIQWNEATPATQFTLNVAIPGKYTTANFLLGLAFPGLIHKQETLFSSIETDVMEGKVDLGLIIHENRFTYEAKGLKKVLDLGSFWEKLTNLPIPLGGIVVKKELDQELKQKINRVLKKSVQYGFDHPDSGLDYIRQHSQEMEEEVIYKHIELYVNHFSLDLGVKGKSAITHLFKRAEQLKLIPHLKEGYFLNP